MEALQEEMTALRKLTGMSDSRNEVDGTSPNVDRNPAEDRAVILPPRGMVRPVCKIPLSLQEKIWAFQYIDFVQLLSPEKNLDVPLTLFKSTSDETVDKPVDKRGADPKLHPEDPKWFGLISHLSFPNGNSINTFIPEHYSKVNYKSFDSLSCWHLKWEKIVGWLNWI